MLADYLRKISESQSQSTAALDEQFHKRERELAVREESAKKQCQESRDTLAASERSLQASCNLLESFIEDVKKDRFSNLEVLATTNPDTRKIFYEDYNAPSLAVSCNSLRVFGKICALARQYPRKCTFDYRSSIQGGPPLYQEALSHKNPAFSQIMLAQFMHDLEDIAQSADLFWLLAAIRLKPELINMHVDRGSRAEQLNPTLAMCLAEHNQLAVLKKILTILKEKALDAQVSSLPPAYNFFRERDRAGNSILHYALKEGHGDLALWLLNSQELELTPLEQASKDGAAEDEVRRLMALPQPLEHKQASLMIAIIANQPAMVNYLVNCGGLNVQYKDNLAVITAIRYGHWEIAKTLIDKGADILAQDNLVLQIIDKLTPENSGLTSAQLSSRQAAVHSFMEQYRHTSSIFQQQEAARKARELEEQKVLAAQKAKQAQKSLEDRISFSDFESRTRMALKGREEQERNALKNTANLAEAEVIRLINHRLMQQRMDRLAARMGLH